MSSRSGDVLTKATGQSINSSTRFTYLTACAGRSAQLRAPAVDWLQPYVTYSRTMRAPTLQETMVGGDPDFTFSEVVVLVVKTCPVWSVSVVNWPKAS